MIKKLETKTDQRLEQITSLYQNLLEGVKSGKHKPQTVMVLEVEDDQILYHYSGCDDFVQLVGLIETMKTKVLRRSELC